jgi:hypothetical protein
MNVSRKVIHTIAAAAVVAVTLGGLAATPASAEGWRDHDRRGWRENEWREHEGRDHDWRWHQPYYAAPGYYYAPPPPVIYAPPPRVYAPPPSFTFVFPFELR